MSTSEDRQAMAEHMDASKEAIVRRINESTASVAAGRPDVQSAVSRFTSAVEERFNSAKADVERMMADRGK